MSISEELNLGGLAVLGTLGSVCAILLRSTHQNLKTLDSMRRDAAAATDKLRQELRVHDHSLFELQAMCADYRFTIAKLEADNQHLRRELWKERSKKANPNEPPARPDPDPRRSEPKPKFKNETNPEDVL